MRILTILVLAATLTACTKASDKQLPIPGTTNNTPAKTLPMSDSLTYLALGDSYTIGQSVPIEHSFPLQLTGQLNATGHFVINPKIIAVTGWTTGDLINAIHNSDLGDKQFDIITLLIGVNNQFRGNSADEYRTEFVQLLHTAISHAKGGKSHVFVLSIPDWGVTPFAKNGGYDAQKVGAQIDLFNAINKEETQKLDVTYVDITPASRKASYDPSLIADDGLHPAAIMYSLWVSQLLPLVSAQIK
jgi:lysophospholipase L1-like esterase